MKQDISTYKEQEVIGGILLPIPINFHGDYKLAKIHLNMLKSIQCCNINKKYTAFVLQTHL